MLELGEGNGVYYCSMVLENKLNITDQVELARAEEKISKQKAKQLFDSGDIEKAEVGTFHGLSYHSRSDG
jgi:cell filamentation protein